jgi:nucleoside-diphosphate-sugar epimerase
MRIVVVGATGNVGTSVLESLAGTDHEVIAVARRRPSRPLAHAEFVSADIAEADLVSIFKGADAVVHLAWLIQPGRVESVTRRVNVDGSQRVFDAVVASEVPLLVYASSVGTYSPGPKGEMVDESWPTDGIPSSFYARHKAGVERLLDQLERDHPELRVVRMRPALIFKRSAATEIRRLFAGPLLPGALLRPGLIPFVPDVPGLRFQAVHSLDVGDAYRLALTDPEARGAYNLAADPPVGPAELGALFGARRARVPPAALRAAAAVTYQLRLQPSEPGWVDMALSVPLMDSVRARTELGWVPRYSSLEALRELLEGMRAGADADTPPLARQTSGRFRVRELLTGVGGRA